MFTRNRLSAAAALATVLVAGGSYAALTTEEHGASRAEIAAVLAATQPPADAIRAAEAKSGGHASAFGVEQRDGTIAYEVQLATAAGSTRMSVGLATGAATEMPATDGETEDAAAGPPPPMPLAAAVTAAERQTGGRAFLARIAAAGGQPVVVVTTAIPA